MDLYDQLPNSSLVYTPEFRFLLECSETKGISVVDYLTLPTRQLSILVNRSITEVSKFQQLLKNDYSTKLYELNPIKRINSNDIPRFFTTGDSNLDKLLGGGIFTHGITEIYGESATGKSQLLMQLSLSIQLPNNLNGFGAQCVFITTEGNLPTKRINEIIHARVEFKDNGISQDNIFTVNCNDWVNQEHILNVQLPVLLEQNPSIKLVIIDSISHHLRVELENKSFKDSQDNRFQIDKMAENLLDLAQSYGCAIVVANQVGEKPLPDHPLQQNIMDYEYQLGYMVGWKKSSILYRQYLHDEKFLSDDEDYTMVANYTLSMNKRLRKSQIENSSFNTPSSDTQNLDPKQNSSQKNLMNSYTNICKRKRKVDTKIPNLGQSWTNHLTTRIMLEKSYKAASMVEKKEMRLDRPTDSLNLWETTKKLRVVFSSFTNQDELAYVITNSGISSCGS